MLRLGRLCARPLLRNDLPLACFGRQPRLGPDAARNVATTSSSSAGRQKPPPPPAKKTAVAVPLSKGPLGMVPRPPVVAAPKVHTPKQPKHGRLTRKARAPKPKKWVKPKPRAHHARTANRARLRRRRMAAIFTNPRARVARFRLGFHTLHHTRPLRRGRRGRLPAWLRSKLASAHILQSRRNRRRMGRPDISLARPRRWNRPIPEGILPAYDEALRVIRVDARHVRKEAGAMRREVARAHQTLSAPGEIEGEARRALESELEKMRAKLHILDVQSEVNLPEVRWSVQNGMADLSIPSHRHLVEQRWRKDGDLDLLMERIHQMNVIPDVLPVLHPTVDLHLTARLMPEHFDSLMRRNTFQRRVNTFKEVIPGNYLTPQQTRVPPKLYVNVFHTDVRLYTMLLVDPDVPDEANQTFTTFLHWLKPNIPLSATHVGRIPFLNTHTRYIPPHPQRGTPYHRYTVLLLPQPPLVGHRYTRNTEVLLTAQQERLTQSLRDRAAGDQAAGAAVEAAVAQAVGRRARHMHHPTHPNAGLPHPKSGEDPLAHIVTLSQRLGMPVVPNSARLGFDVRAFAKQWGLNGALGAGSICGARCGTNKPQPKYGRPPRYDPQRTAHAAPTRQRYRAWG
ncbi:hypothetical protein B0H17DRAFT_1141370 [Mycena rosella]|uniref:PEBP-like protein n=1 Tax=Mycena rosella TaxID=1033263 RepID=A0AAD7D0F2_MYCRO|nr:hypothetical protein B0H17DRAFT_1141370 [Mycena rosella]